MDHRICPNRLLLIILKRAFGHNVIVLTMGVCLNDRDKIGTCRLDSMCGGYLRVVVDVIVNIE